ncbi:MAG: helix-turn-helix domain-containing protein [Phycisphaerales bacterium]|nr:helix-turn-helix domain-containing protein [Phycisphaerales bacterium]
MAKEYLTIDEVVAELGLSQDRVKSLVADGTVREYRDGPTIYYKRAEMENLGGEGSSIVDLSSPANSPDEISLDDNESFASALSSLADSSAALGALDESPAEDSAGLPALDDTGSAILLDASDSGAAMAGGQDSSGFDLADIPDELPADPTSVGEDTFTSEIDLLPDEADDKKPAPAPKVEVEPEPVALDEIPDLGLSGSSIISLEPNDSQVAGSPMPSASAKEDTRTMKAGISVFDDDEIEIETDPMGETQISSGVADFDAIGSGSGLLDLTQESDDTSLGNELLDVISPTDATEVEIDAMDADTITEDVPATMIEDDQAIGGSMSSSAPMAPSMAARRAPTGVMPGATPINIMIFLGILAAALLGLATTASLQGVWPSAVFDAISNGVIHVSVFGGLALIAIVCGILGIMAGRK